MENTRFTSQAIVFAAAGNKATSILMATVMAVYIGIEGSPVAVSFVLAAFFFGQMLFAPVWGAIADVTKNHRGVLVASASTAALVVLPLTVVDGVWGPLALRTLYSALIAGFLPVMLTIMNKRGGTNSRGRVVGLFGSAAAVGSMFGRSISGPLINYSSRPSIYLFLGILGGLVAVACLLVEGSSLHETNSSIETSFSDALRERLIPVSWEQTTHLRTNGLHWVYVASFFRSATVLGISSLLPVYLVSELRFSPAIMGIVLGINPGVQMIGMYSLGRVSDVTGRKGLIIGGLAGSGIFALVVGAASLPASPRLRVVVVSVGMLILGIAYSGLQTGIIAFIGDVAPTKRKSELIGLRSTARGFGGVVGPPLLGVSATIVGYEEAFAAASLLTFGSALLVAGRLIESHDPAATSSEKSASVSDNS